MAGRRFIIARTAATSYVRERERIFLRWVENLERLLNQPVDRDAAYKVWRDGYSVREYAGERRRIPPRPWRRADRGRTQRLGGGDG